ncbi:hypothetical protein BUALT_Bualt15G0042100 [Buddleja alternifolia]|uniref:DDE Tnp4 domain-containing protein n=1 Tax=Buddleja alternifolia TaxID=168488 RepID=A0AAV6WHT0_9LAMI|nr:hypothetical protein BUALT_Bualt15G0042100 [Buddleja alternifolia]
MNSRALAALLSSLLSQLLILLSLVIIPPSNHPLTITTTPYNHDFQESRFSLLHHFLSTSDIAATLAVLSSSRKRKRAHRQAPDDAAESRLGRLGRVDSVIPRNPDSFKQFFRMNTSSFEWLCGLLEPLLDCRDPVNSPLDLSIETRLGIGLFRLAAGADYSDISTRFRVSVSDSKFCVKQLCRVLCTNYRFWVGFPSHTELDSVSTRFETLTGLPNCCGIVHTIRFNIETGDEFDSNYSIAAQFVVDSSSRILSVIAGFRGNKSDMQILESSTLFRDVEKRALLNSPRRVSVNDVDVPQYLVGIGEYALLPWLLVPFIDPEPGSIEENFNNVCNLMRVSSLKAMASLRNWGVLSRDMKMEYKIAVACIGACSILHNMLIMREDYSAFCDELDDQVSNNQKCSSLEGNSIEDKALAIRKALATRAKS